MSWKSKQLTHGAKHYGITTAGAMIHVETMLETDADWNTLTGFDRACIAEIHAFAQQGGESIDRHPAAERKLTEHLAVMVRRLLDNPGNWRSHGEDALIMYRQHRKL